MDMSLLYTRVSKSIVAISASEAYLPILYDGIIVARKDCDVVIIVDEYVVKGHERLTEVHFANGKSVRASKCHARGSGIAVIECYGLNEDQLLDLEEIDIFRGSLLEFEEVYTYSDRHESRVLTPGNITSVSDGGFNHTCSAHIISTCGSPVFNQDAQLVGICFGYADKLKAYNIDAVARRVMRSYNRTFVSVDDTIQYLHQ